jgi:hypothetical protein
MTRIDRIINELQKLKSDIRPRPAVNPDTILKRKLNIARELGKGQPKSTQAALRRNAVMEAQAETGHDFTALLEIFDTPTETDAVQDFLTERTAIGPGTRVKAAKLYQEYSAWCRDHNRPQLTRFAFTKELRKKIPALSVVRPGGVTTWRGVAVI